MRKDRFKGYREDVRPLVEDFERMLGQGSNRFFDLDQIELVIDFYLDSHDLDMLDRSVSYAESIYPQANSIRLRRAHMLCAHERYKEALHLLSELERIEPDNTDVMYALGAVYSALDNPRKAIQYLLRASVDGVELGMVYGNIADEYVRLGQEREAVQYYRRSLKANPEDERSIANLANCYESTQSFDKSVEYFSHFVEENPYSKVAWFCLGSAYFGESLFERAIDSFEYSLAIDKTYNVAYFSLAETYHRLGENAKAVETLRESLLHVDDKAAVYFNMAALFVEQHNVHTAVIYYKKAIEEDCYFADAWMELAYCYLRLDDYTAAVDSISKAVEINPQSPEYLMALARIHVRFDHPELASPLYDCATAMADDNDDYWIEYADIMMEQELWDDSIDILQQALLRCSDAFPFNLRLAVCYFRSGRRNFLFNALRSCVHDNIGEIDQLFELCPEMKMDYEVLNLITSYQGEDK